MFDDGDALGRRGQRAGTEVNPMDGLINIADAFLVFTFVVLAMFISYLVNSVDSSIGIIDTGNELTTVSDTEELAEDIDGEGDFSMLGTVYVDNATGKMYVVQEGAADGGGTAEAGGAEAEAGGETTDGTGTATGETAAADGGTPEADGDGTQE